MSSSKSANKKDNGTVPEMVALIRSRDQASFTMSSISISSNTAKTKTIITRDTWQSNYAKRTWQGYYVAATEQ